MKPEVYTITTAPFADLIIMFYLVFGVPTLFYMENINATIWTGVGILVALLIHLVINRDFQEKKFWRRVAQPIWIVDHGPWGKHAWKMMPPHLKNEVIFVPREKVHSTLALVESKLESCLNPIYFPYDRKPLIELQWAMYGYGEHVNELDGDYQHRLINEMEAYKLEYHTTVANADDGSGIDPDAYDEIFVYAGNHRSVQE